MTTAENLYISGKVPFYSFEMETPKVIKNPKSPSFIKKAAGMLNERLDLSNKTLTLSRRIFALLMHSGKLIGQTFASIREIDVHIKALSALNVPAALFSIPGQIVKIWKNVHWKDYGGIAHSAALLTLTVASIFDDIVTTIDAALQIQSLPSLDLLSSLPGTEWIANMAAPFGIAVSSLVAFLKCNNLYQLSKFNRELSRKTSALKGGNVTSHELRAILSPFLKKHLGEGPKRDKAQSALERHTSGEVVAYMLKIENILDENATPTDDQIAKIMKLLDASKKAIRSKKKLETGLLVAATVSLVAWSLFLTPIGPIAPFVLLAISGAIQIGMKVHYNRKLKQRQTAMQGIKLSQV